jgi:hypothetical protein
MKDLIYKMVQINSFCVICDINNNILSNLIEKVYLIDIK